eukprot:EG_transcript_28254
MATAAAGDNVFVGGLPYEWSEGEVNMLFSSCGTIISSIVLRDRATGQSKGAAMVRFGDATQAAYAIQCMNGYVVDPTGRKLDIKLAERPEDKAARKALRGPQQQTPRFSPYGQPHPQLLQGAMAALGLGMPRGPMGGGGFGGFPVPGAAPPTAFGPIQVPRRQDLQPEEGANLHVFGLDHQLTDLHLYQAFAPYGAIRSVRVIHDKATGNPKGYGFVQYYY